MLKYIFLFFFCFSLFSFSQKETYNWYFGYGAGITFMPDGNMATFLPDGEFERSAWLSEGVSTLSDNNGNLLFYSNGATVWNKYHKPVKNGLGLHGGKGSARSVVIIPKPNSTQYYYAFTIEAHEDMLVGSGNYYRYGLRYSIIDMLGDNGNGEIVAGQKNLPLLNNAVEKMITINHSNQTDVWLVAYNWTDNSFYIYLITRDKIELTGTVKRPYSVKSDDRFLLTSNNLEYDIDSKRLIDCDAGKGFVIYDFDPAYGTINTSNAIILPASPPDWDPTDSKSYWPYSGAFSEDGKRFYGTCLNHVLLQYNFSHTNVEDIIASRAVIADANTAGIDNTNFGALRRGPDNNIYVTCDTSWHLGIIENPNASAEECNYNPKGIYLEGTQCGYGLPIMMQYASAPCVFAGAAGRDISACVGSEVELGSKNFDNGTMSFEWNPKTGLDNPYSINPKCIVTETMQYVLTVTDDINSCSNNDTIMITATNPPAITKAEDITVCKAQPIMLGNAAWNDVYLYEWTPADYLSDSHSKMPTCIPDSDIEYVVSILDAATGCYNYDTIRVDVITLDDFEITGSFFVCMGRPTTLTVAGDFASYVWSTGETTKSITVSEPCTLEISVTTSDGCSGKQTIVIQTLGSDNFNIVAPQHICAGIPVELSTNMEFTKYTWSTGETTPTATISEAGMYWVAVENEYGCTASDTIIISAGHIDYNLSLDKITFSDLCYGQAAPIVNNFTNGGSEDIVIDTIFTVGNSYAFGINYFEFPFNVAPQTSVALETSFNGTEDGVYTDTLVVIISSPCSAKILVPLYANSGGTRFVISTQPGEVEPGKSIAIPVVIKHETVSHVNEEFVFTIKCDVRWDMLDVTGVRGGVIKERIKDVATWTETLLIESTYPANTSSVSIELEANAFIGRDTLSLIKYYDFGSDVPCLLADSAVGTVKLIGCNISIRIFDFFNTTKLQVASRPKVIACKVTTEEQGEFILEVFDLAGNLVKRHNWRKNEDNLEEFQLIWDMEISAGSYFVTLKSPGNYLTQKVIIKD